MAEIVGSAVATEAVSRISSILSGDKPSHESVEDKAERLEMAVLKIRSVVAVSEDLPIPHPPLLRWKAKLKRVAEEGDDLLQTQHKKQALERNRVSDGPTNSSISRYLIQAARRFVPFRRKEDDELALNDSTLRRFERIADGADSFFRLVESGGRPKKPTFLPSLTRSLLAGDAMELSIRGHGGGSDLIMLWPWLDPGVIGNGLQACLAVSHEDEAMWEKNLKMCVVFRLSEASDILAIAVGCLELLPPQFDAAGVAIRRLLTETIGQRCDASDLSERSMWCRRHIQSHSRNGRKPSTGDEQHRGARMLLPRQGSSAHCKLLRLATHRRIVRASSRAGVPCVSTRLFTSMYCTVGPAISQPQTVAQVMQSSGSGAPRGRRKVAKTKSQSVSKSLEIAKSQ